MRQLLSKLRANNIQLKLAEGKLSIRYPKGEIDKLLLEEISLQKENLIKYLTSLNQAVRINIPSAKEQSDYPLSSSQRRLWLLSQAEGGRRAYNIPGAYYLGGRLDEAALERAFG